MFIIEHPDDDTEEPRNYRHVIRLLAISLAIRQTRANRVFGLLLKRRQFLEFLFVPHFGEFSLIQRRPLDDEFSCSYPGRSADLSVLADVLEQSLRRCALTRQKSAEDETSGRAPVKGPKAV
jgi:hypothetical protein